MHSLTCMSVVVGVVRKPRPCNSYSRRRDRINSVLWRSYYKGGEVGERGTVVPLLTIAASAPWHLSHAGAVMLHTKASSLSRDNGVWRVLTPLMWGM